MHERKGEKVLKDYTPHRIAHATQLVPPAINIDKIPNLLYIPISVSASRTEIAMTKPPPPDALDAFGDPQPSTISERQLAANRLNAQRSTGPKGEAGQARSSFNGLKHGLYAQTVVLPGEDVEAFEAMLDNLKAELKPQGRAEEGMVRRAADLWWRLSRTAAIEAGFLSPDWSGDPRAGRFNTGGGPLIDGFRVALDDTQTLDQLGRYEARLERALKRAFDLIYMMQAQRRRMVAGRNDETSDEGGEQQAKNPDP